MTQYISNTWCYRYEQWKTNNPFWIIKNENGFKKYAETASFIQMICILDCTDAEWSTHSTFLPFDAMQNGDELTITVKKPKGNSNEPTREQNPLRLVGSFLTLWKC